jgi:hypothetical protein
MPTSLYFEKTKKYIKQDNSFNSYCNLTITEYNIFFKDENLLEINRLSIKEVRARFYQNRSKEDKLNEQRNFYKQLYLNRDKKFADIELRIQSGVTSETDVEENIDNFFENVSTTVDSLKFIINYPEEKRDKKTKYFKKQMLKELEQVQLIINHSLAEECRKHDIDPQLIRLIPFSQDSNYSESTVYNNIDIKNNNPFGDKNINKKYKKWLKNKTKNLNDLQSQIVLKLGVIDSNDKEYAEIEEKVLAPARLKLNIMPRT